MTVVRPFTLHLSSIQYMDIITDVKEEKIPGPDFGSGLPEMRAKFASADLRIPPSDKRGIHSDAGFA